MSVKEAFILEQIRRDVDRGLKLLLDTYHTTLCEFALKYIDSFEEAEELVQEVIINFWEKRRYQTINSSLKSYLLTAVRNKALKYIEKTGRVVLSDIEEVMDDVILEQPDTDWLDAQKKILQAELNKLPEKRREVVENIIFRGMKYKEVAEEMGISLNTVKTHFYGSGYFKPYV